MHNPFSDLFFNLLSSLDINECAPGATNNCNTNAVCINLPGNVDERLREEFNFCVYRLLSLILLNRILLLRMQNWILW
jgi:hypothetical protein